MSVSILLSTLYLAAGLLILFMGFVILRQNSRSPVNRASAMMLFSGALGSILGALGQLLADNSELQGGSAPGYLRTFSYLWEFFFPSLLYFALAFPVVQPFMRRRQIVEIALYVPHLFHLGLVLLLTESGRLTRPVDLLLQRLEPGGVVDVLAMVLDVINVLVALMNKVHEQLFSLVNLAYAGVAIALLHHSRRRVAGRRVREQLALVLAGLTFCVVAYVAAMISHVFFPYTNLARYEVALVSVGLIVASTTMAYAIVRYKFLEMQNLGRRSILFGGTALIFTLLYLVVVKQVTRYSAAVFGPNVEVIEAGFIVLLVVLFQPLFTSLEDIVEALTKSGGKGGVQATIGDLSRRLAAEVDLRGIRERISGRLEPSLMASPVHLWTLEGHEANRCLDQGQARVPAPVGGAFDHLLLYFADAPHLVLRGDLDRALKRLEIPRDSELEGWLRPYTLLVPLVRQDRVHGLLAVGPKHSGGRFRAEDMALLGVLAQQVTASIENVRLVSGNVQKLLLEEEIALAAQIQRGLLPAQLPERPGYSTHAVSYASKFVGGDYYDVFDQKGDRLHVAIADVSGKGVSAALLMSSLRAALHSNVALLQSPAQVLERINRLLFESTSSDRFATFFYGVLDTDTHELVYANAGHNYPILLRASGAPAAELTEGGLLLGAFPDATYEEARIQLDLGDVLFLYTDGITEATNGNEEDFGEQRLHAVLRRQALHAPRQLVEGVLEEVRSFTHGADPEDDVTVLVVRRDAPGAAYV